MVLGCNTRMKTLFRSLLLGVACELLFAVIAIVGQRISFCHDLATVSHAPALFFARLVFGAEVFDVPASVPKIATLLSFIVLLQSALYSFVAFGVLNLIQYARQKQAVS